MKVRQLCFLALSLGVLPLVTAAQPGHVNLRQDGETHLADIQQYARDSRIEVQQRGESASAYISQSGANSLGFLRQPLGVGNNIKLEQVDSGGAYVGIKQEGHRNSALVVQENSPDSEIRVSQGIGIPLHDTNRNEISILQSDSANATINSVLFSGSDNITDIKQLSSDGAAIILQRWGSSNYARLLQDNSPSSEIIVNQRGSNNQVEVSQLFETYSSNVNQIGSGHFAKIEQGRQGVANSIP